MAFKKIKARLRNRRLRKNGIAPDPAFAGAIPMGRSDRWDTWHIIPLQPGQKATVYSFGVGTDISFDLAMIDQYNVELHAFDPTSASKDWLRHQELPRDFHFHDLGLSHQDGTISLFPPKREGQHNFSQEKLAYVTDRHRPVEVPVAKLETIMKTLGHQHLDVLKIDIEGAEFDAIPDILQSGCSIGQILVEIHYHFPTRSFAEGAALINSLKRAGFTCFYISDRGYEFGFIKK